MVGVIAPLGVHAMEFSQMSGPHSFPLCLLSPSHDPMMYRS